MKKLIWFIFCSTLIASCSDPRSENEATTTAIDSSNVIGGFKTIESVEKGVSLMKGFWYNPSFFEKVKTTHKVKENLKGNYQYFYLNEEGLDQRIEGFTGQDYIPVNFAVKDNRLLVYDHATTICWITLKNDSVALIKTFDLNKDTVSITLKKLNGDVSKKTELDQYEYLLGINTVVGKYINDKGEQIEFMADGTFTGLGLNTEYFVEGLGYEGLDGDYEFDAISIKNEETLMTYKWTLDNNILTLTEIETVDDGGNFKLSLKPLIFKKK